MSVYSTPAGPVYERDPEQDLTTQEIAERYGVSVIAVGNWCRKGHLVHAYRTPVQRGGGIIALEWRVPEAVLTEFTPPNPKGGRPSRLAPARGRDVVDPAAMVLAAGEYGGWTLEEVWDVNEEYVRGLAWGASERSALTEFVAGQAQAFLATKGEAPPPVAPPDRGVRGDRVWTAEGGEVGLLVDVDEEGVRLMLVSEMVAVAHVLPHGDGRVLGLALAGGRLEEPFYDYGGRGGVFTALVVEEKGEGARFPLVVKVRQGAGRPGPEGMRPEDGLTTLSLALSRWEGRRLGVALSDFLLLRSLRNALARE